MGLVPLNTLFEGDSRTTEDIQSTANGQVHLAIAADMYLLKILQAARAPGVCDGNGAPLCQLRHQLFIDTLLKPLYIGSMDQKFGAVGFQKGDRF